MTIKTQKQKIADWQRAQNRTWRLRIQYENALREEIRIAALVGGVELDWSATNDIATRRLAATFAQEKN